MFKCGLSLLLSISLIGPFGHAEEAMSLESSAELSVGSAESLSEMLANEPFFFIYVLGSDTVAYLLTTAGVLLTIGGTIMKINKPHLQRRYRDAAAEARTLKIAYPAEPIRHAGPHGSLVEVLKRERAVAEQTGFAIDKLTEPQLANLVIVRAKLLELP